MLGRGGFPKPRIDVDVSGSEGSGGGIKGGIGSRFLGSSVDEAPKSPRSNRPICTNGTKTCVSRAYVGVA